MAHILEGESLLNDASGLVAFNFAIAAVLTGSFSPGDAVVKFFLMAFGGILNGLVVVWVTGKCNNFLVRRTREEPAIQILISLLIPFAAYLLAEAFHVSGILAAVAAGIAMHYEQLSGPRLPATRMKSSAVWSMLQTTLNGMIFLMLGEQLPRMLRTLPAVASQAGVSSPWYLLLYAVAITLALGLMRFAWVWLSMKLTIFRRKRRGKAITVRPRFSILAVMALAGVKGSVTLAGILTLPVVLADGSPFPGRELLIFLSMAVILMSLVVAAIGLPFMTRYLADDLPHDTGKDDIGAVMTEVAINRLTRYWTSRWRIPVSRPCGPMPAICCSKPISGGFTITTMTRGRMSGWSWLSAPGWRNICNERSLSPSVRSCSGCAAPITSAISLFMRCCGR